MLSERDIKPGDLRCVRGGTTFYIVIGIVKRKTLRHDALEKSRMSSSIFADEEIAILLLRGHGDIYKKLKQPLLWLVNDKLIKRL